MLAVDSFVHIVGQLYTIIKVCFDDVHIKHPLRNYDDVKRIVCLAEMLKIHAGSTLSISIKSAVSEHEYRADENLMHITINLLDNLDKLLQRLTAPQQLIDGILPNNYSTPVQLGGCAIRRIWVTCDRCLDQERIRNLTLIDEREPQAIAFRLPLPRDHPEAVLGRNSRKVSLTRSVKDRGSCSGFVTVLAVFKDHLGSEYSKYGAAAVIDDWHVLTVGHIFWDREFGLAKSITVQRDARAGSDDRFVDAGATHFQWVKNHSTKNDFSILHVSQAFPKGVRRMSYRTTPISDNQIRVKVYGFPKDMLRYKNGQAYPQLCFSHSDVQYFYGQPLLDHDGDTEQGNSGGPLVDSSRTVMAVHRGCGSKAVVVDEHGRKVQKFIPTNMAVAINHHGNDVDKFIKYMDAMLDGLSVKDPHITRGVSLLHDGWRVAGFGWDENKVVLGGEAVRDDLGMFRDVSKKEMRTPFWKGWL